MSREILIKLEVPDGLKDLKLPATLDQRLQELLDQQDRGDGLSAGERREAEALVEMAEMLSLLRLRAQEGSQGQDGAG